MTQGLDLAEIATIDAKIPPALRGRTSFLAYAIFAITEDTETLSVEEDVDLTTVKKGDMVRADFVEMFAVQVSENEPSTTSD